MRRPLLTRCVAAVLAVWLALVVGEAGLVHVCPEHDGVAAHATGHATGRAVHHGDAHHHGAPSHEHKGCTCVGCCTVTALVALVPRATTLPVVVALVVPAAAAPTAGLLPRPGPRYARPLTTGPPRA